MAGTVSCAGRSKQSGTNPIKSCEVFTLIVEAGGISLRSERKNRIFSLAMAELEMNEKDEFLARLSKRVDPIRRKLLLFLQP